MKTPLFIQSSFGAAVWICVAAVLARVHVLATAQSGEDLGGAVSHRTRLHVEQIADFCLQAVTDVAERGSVGQDGLPVGAGARDEGSADLGRIQLPIEGELPAPVGGDGMAQLGAADGDIASRKAGA
jgi:hypothetical protein